MLNCLKCMKISKPEIIVVEKLDQARLCDRCGNAMYNIVEQIDWEPTEAQLDLLHKEINGRQIEGFRAELEQSGEIVEQMEAKPPEGGEIAKGLVIGFDELDGMSAAEMTDSA